MAEKWSHTKSFLCEPQYCLSCIHYYYRRFRIKENKEPASFINLEVTADALSPVAHIELIVPDGKRLLFHQGVSVDFIKALIG